MAPHERIAPHVTRRGRFLRVDPGRGRPLPGRWKWVGFAAWAAWMAYPLARAWRERPD